MKVDEFKPNPEFKKDSSVKQAKELLESAENIEGLVCSWMAENRKIKFCQGEDDDGKFTSLGILLIEDGDYVADIYIDLKNLAKLCPDNVPVSEADHSGEEGAPKFITYDDANESQTDAWFAKRDERLKVEYSDVLCASVIGTKAAIEVAISYATAENGTATLQMVDDFDDISEGEEPDIFKKEGLMWLELEYCNRKTLQGWGESMYVSA